MPTFHSRDAQIYYDVQGSGPDVVLLHPFPLNHNFWDGVAPQLHSRYRLIVPDLRAHGDSGLGEGAATMHKHAEDLARLCREERISKARFVGVSIGGYILFEFWRRYREHFSALVLANTRAGAETAETRATRLQAAEHVLREGVAGFAEEMAAKLVSPATRANRPDIVDKARGMMLAMSPEDVAGVQHGMADRPDSMATLPTINVSTLLITGADDVVPVSEMENMRRQIPGARLQVIPSAGHYAALEKPEEFGSLLRRFFDELSRN